ncbi:MAG: Xaa-Pro peptidase family protein [Candidatus ainarchaeum sp.]|nr:Xaa-Pro peptidase family protein [Candidatus ainarchaeum sp.]
MPIILFNFKNYWKHPFVNKYLDGEKYEGILVIQNKKNIFFSHPFNFNQLKKESIKQIIVKEYSITNFKKILLKEKELGYDSKYTTVSQLNFLKKTFNKKKFVDCSKIIEEKREIKNQTEINNILIASKQTKKTINKAKKLLKKGISEKTIELFVNNDFKKNGCTTAFCIIAFGKNTLNLHHSPTNKKLDNGPVLFDIGAKYNGYCADISTSFWFGKKDKNYLGYEKDLKLVKNSLKKIENILKSGLKANKLFLEVSDLNLPHAIGHGIGLEEHDFPTGIGLNSNWILKEGMVIAIEPGKYDKFGIRVEKNYLIKKDGFKEL